MAVTWSTIGLRESARRSMIRTLGRVHRTVVRMGGGRLLGHVAGMPVLLLTTRGRRTGKLRTVPLTYLRDGVDLVVVGSFGGSDRAPAWWLNLEHDPRAAVQLDSVTIAISARTAAASERERLWPMVIGVNPGYGRYQSRTRRQIPIVLLTPTDACSSARTGAD